ncbi:transposable element Tcb2 transposase [Trichonephila clavipes]|nr:transposable element Tcb2 transposase [Trichonephila clavipes]
MVITGRNSSQRPLSFVRCWDQWIEKVSFTRRPGSERPRQTSHREESHIVRNTRVQPTAPSAGIQAQCGLPLKPTHRRLRLEYCHARENWTAAEWNQIVFSDESKFNLSSDDNRVRVWRSRGERFNPAFDLQRHTVPTVGVTVWSAIGYNTRSPLAFSRGTMAAQRYVHDILQPHVLPLRQRLPGAIFQQDILGLTRKGCHKTFSALLLPFLGLPIP